MHKTNDYDWPVEFKRLYDSARAKYVTGHRDPHTLFSRESAAFLESIGARPVEVFDFAEDADDVSWETALLITATRRNYFRRVQEGRLSTKRLKLQDFPPKNAEIDGIAWLPRLIRKAEARLRGELPDELMYCCGGDRRFFREWSIHPADFLSWVWNAEGDTAKIVDDLRQPR